MIYIATYRSKQPIKIYTATHINEAKQLAGKLWDLQPSKWNKILITEDEETNGTSDSNNT